MEGIKVLAPPKAPPGRIFTEGDTNFCPKCHSGIKMGGFLWLKELGCRQPECEIYYGK